MIDDVIDLVPILERDGSSCGEWPEDGTAGVPSTSPPTSIVVSDGTLLSGGGRAVKLSLVPTGRMASNDAESWVASSATSSSPSQASTPVTVSRCGPAGCSFRCARTRRVPRCQWCPRTGWHRRVRQVTTTDLLEARRYDPSNVENWRFVDDPVIPGLRFTLRPVTTPFIFFGFKVPSFGGRWFLSVLDPVSTISSATSITSST